jgi:hypothetical protein
VFEGVWKMTRFQKQFLRALWKSAPNDGEPDQRMHWVEFALQHHIELCGPESEAGVIMVEILQFLDRGFEQVKELVESADILTQQDALRAYAKMMNNLSVEHLEPLLADDFHYSSQWVLDEISSKEEYLAYIRPKLQAIRQSGSRVFAEMGTVSGQFCLVMAQGSKDDVQATVLAKVAGDKIVSLAMCLVPHPDSAVRTGEYPR